jgi:thiamine-phosphate pyrophosphorylase
MMDFLLAILSLPGGFAGEADTLEALLEAGVDRLHLRKPEMEVTELEALVKRLAPRWGERLVLHGPRAVELAMWYGVPNVHGVNGRERRLKVSMSVHSWEELGRLPAGLEYAFISPVFDSISKKGYNANASLLQRPSGELPCRPMALGGVGAATIGELLKAGWTGAAVLGWIWEEPGAAVRRFEQLKLLIDG